MEIAARQDNETPAIKLQDSQMMELKTHIASPARSTVIGFLFLVAIAMAMALARAIGLVDVAVEQRVLGLVIGAMIVVTGNFLPKMRPLNVDQGNPARTTAAERLAGWVLLLAGLAYIALFVFAPVDQARHFSSVIGIGAIGIIAVDWIWLARSVLFATRKPTGNTSEMGRRLTRKRKAAIWLLVAFFYVLVTACVTFFFYDTPRGHQIGSWSIVVFSSIFALFYGFLGDKCSDR
jgi:hypothetical protein